MIWINLSNILKVSKFSGIARTEYELTVYAYKLKKLGLEIRFSTYDPTIGFVEVNDIVIEKIIYDLKNNHVNLNSKLSFYPKLKRSFLKRLIQCKLFFKSVTYPYSNNDIVIIVGQDMISGEMLAFSHIKSKIKLELKLLCHDLIPINFPQFFPDQNVKLFTKYMKQVTDSVDKFYCNSEYTKNELISFYKKNNYDIRPMKTVTLGCDLFSKENFLEPGSLVNNIFSEKYLLFVSTIEVRKNHELIYNMYLELINNGVKNLPKVYFVGRRGWKVESFLNKFDLDSRVKDKIIILEGISDSDLINLYKNCWFTLYPSFIEGYGLPVAESLSFGKYCLCSSAGSLPEAGGDYIDYLSPYELNEWVSKFKFLIETPEYIMQKEELIKQNYKPTSWQTFAQQILELDDFKNIDR
ncbi:glycosyltransferase family 4 protein [Acinetobacter sp. Ver3]|uniref:glycosyltransferase family 4 protein n=1 Tax=Acinetobacter sp. Ver3 TaxID=466088 RepID=UPI0004477B48|nr:glycosyltransferase [Acinetobacter sp. Ver3]EZQ11616.1 hypothetical protein CL42_04525 [Acinetobacter sp. Ver3]